MSNEAQNIQIVRLPELKKIVGLSRSQIYLLISEGKFPKQIRISDRASGWVRSEVNAWLNERIAQSRASGGDDV